MINCADARHLIHLEAGGDVERCQEDWLSAHLGRCEECRGYHSAMSGAMRALCVLRDFDPAGQEPVESYSAADRQSSWPAIAARLPVRRSRSWTPRQFNSRVAVLSVCSLALAVVTIVQSLPMARTSPDFSGDSFALPGQFGLPDQNAFFGHGPMPAPSWQPAETFPVSRPTGFLSSGNPADGAQSSGFTAGSSPPFLSSETIGPSNF